jgi:hypothetical protein
MSIKITCPSISANEFLPVSNFLASFPIILEEDDKCKYLFNMLEIEGTKYYTYSVADSHCIPFYEYFRHYFTTNDENTFVQYFNGRVFKRFVGTLVIENN